MRAGLECLRLQRAKALLRTTSLSMADTAARVGFNRPQYFNSVCDNLLAQRGIERFGDERQCLAQPHRMTLHVEDAYRVKTTMPGNRTSCGPNGR